MLHGIKAIFGIGERKSAGHALNDPYTAIILGGAAPTASGIAVSPETAMHCVPVYASVKVLAETVAQLPVKLFRRLSDDGRERATDHPVYALLTEAVNDWTPASEFLLTMTTDYALFGNAYAFVGRAAGKVMELIRLDPRAVTVETDRVTMEPRYVITDSAGVRRDYDRRDILHLRGIGTRPQQGDSPVMVGRESIALAMVLEQHGAGLFGRGARPAGILKYPKALTDEVLGRLRNTWDSGYAGGDKSGRTAILEHGVEFEALQLSSVDAQYLELRKFQLQEIARLWRIPLHLLNDLERTTHSNAEHMGQQFLTFCLLPILKLWTDALTITLLTREERREFYFEFLVDDLARANLAARFEAYSKAINAGVLNPNEARAMENRPPYAGGETFMRPVNTAPAPASGGGTTADSDKEGAE